MYYIIIININIYLYMHIQTHTNIYKYIMYIKYTYMYIHKIHIYILLIIYLVVKLMYQHSSGWKSALRGQAQEPLEGQSQCLSPRVVSGYGLADRRTGSLITEQRHCARLGTRWPTSRQLLPPHTVSGASCAYTRNAKLNEAVLVGRVPSPKCPYNKTVGQQPSGCYRCRLLSSLLSRFTSRVPRGRSARVHPQRPRKCRYHCCSSHTACGATKRMITIRSWLRL